MEKFLRVEGIAAPFLRANVDTDTIIPIIRLVGLDISDLGHWLFEGLRYDSDSIEIPAFVLNQEPFREASILLAGPNFGCGSSREGAVTALYQFGVRCVIAPSFGEIFFGNCFKNGLLPVVLDVKKVEELAAQVAADPDRARIAVDLETRTITSPAGETIRFDIDNTQREKLLKGLDDIAETLQYEEAIAGFQASDREKRPWVYVWGE